MDRVVPAEHRSSSTWYLVVVTCLYSVSLTVSVSFRNKLSRYIKLECLPSVPFGECLMGEYESQLEVWFNYNFLPPYIISFVVALLAGAWSDSHGRRRKPLIFLPIFGQIIVDGLYFVSHFWYWPTVLDTIFTMIIPALFVGRNLFWIGAISYVSESSTFEARTLKLGILVGTYTISTLIGSGMVALLKIVTGHFYYYTLFMVPIFFNIIAILIGYYFIVDTSEAYNKNIMWLKPKYLFKGFTALYKNKMKSFTVALVVLILCQSVLVARVGGEYAYILQYVKYTLRWYDNRYVFFSVIKTLALFFGTLFSAIVLSYKMKINDLVIGIITCSVYIVAALCYLVILNQFFQLLMIIIINFCHGAAITIIISLTSKMVEIEHLGRLNCIQTSMNSLLTFGIIVAFKYTYDNNYYNEMVNLRLTTFLYIVLTLPILFVFIFLYTKCKEFWEKDSCPPQPSIFVISH